MANNTLFDDVFRTLLEKCTKLIIPVINEVFGTDYRMEEKVELLSNEHFYAEGGEKIDRRITDSCIRIRQNMYHIECQSSEDAEMSIRMIEYDFHIALDESRKEDMTVLRFPESAVLYLRHNGNTPDYQKIKLLLPGGQEAVYQIETVKVQNYSRTEIFDKNLLFFIPYYILKFEKRLKEIDENPEQLEKVCRDYEEIYQGLKRLEKQKKIDSIYLHDLVNLTVRLVRYVADKTEHIKREVAYMGGRVLDLESEQILKRGLEQGLEQGQELTELKMLEKYMLKHDVDFAEAFDSLKDLMDLPEDQYLAYRYKIEKRGNVPMPSYPGRSR